MDGSGKIIWSKHNDVQTVNVKSLPTDFEIVDGERLPLAVKDLGSCDLYPQSLSHGPNGRFVTVCGDNEYIIYTALAWRNKSFGAALGFGWSKRLERVRRARVAFENKSLQPVQGEARVPTALQRGGSVRRGFARVAKHGFHLFLRLGRRQE